MIPLKLGPPGSPRFPYPKTKLYGYLNLDFLAQVTSCLLLHPIGASILGLPFQGRLFASMHALVLRGDKAVVFGSTKSLVKLASVSICMPARPFGVLDRATKSESDCTNEGNFWCLGGKT